ncbi:MAG: ChaN family lipoprotein, partial [bacterium]
MPKRALRTTSLAITALMAAPLFTGCTRYFASAPDLTEPSGAIVPRSPASPRSLVMFEGATGRSLGWADVMAAASWADCTFIGERHDDPVAHAVQLAIFEDLAAGYPGTALALEHLERDEQATVNRYLAGEITRDAFIDTTESRNWAGNDTWVVFFQPLVDA